MLRNQFANSLGNLSAFGFPVVNAVALQVDRGWVGAGVVGADYFDGTAIAGAVFLNDHDTVMRLLAGARWRPQEIGRAHV